MSADPLSPTPGAGDKYSQLDDGGMDWVQVRLNGGPPCFHLEPTGRRCGRALRWHHADAPRYEGDHAFVSFAAALAAQTRRAVEQGRREIAAYAATTKCAHCRDGKPLIPPPTGTNFFYAHHDPSVGGCEQVGCGADDIWRLAALAEAEARADAAERALRDIERISNSADIRAIAHAALFPPLASGEGERMLYFIRTPHSFPVTTEQALLIRRGYAECSAVVKDLPGEWPRQIAQMLQQQCDVIYGTGEGEPRGIMSLDHDTTDRTQTKHGASRP